MAIIKRGILGGFQKKIGNVVGSNWKGIDVMRTLPVSVANPRTAKQVEARTKFGTISKVASKLLGDIIKPLWDRFAQYQSGYNAFIKANIGAVGPSGNIAMNQIVIANGKMEATPISVTSGAGTSGPFTFTWTDDSGDGFKLATDQLYIVLADVNFQNVETIPAAAIRSDGTVTVPALSFLPSDGYFAFKREDGTIVSKSYHVLMAM
jgi:hypothetical protein